MLELDGGRVFIGEGYSSLVARKLRESWPNIQTVAIITDETPQAQREYVSEIREAFRISTVLEEPVSVLTYAAVPAKGEACNSREVVAQLERFLIAHGCNVDTCLIALGGTALCELLGFVASSLLGGSPFVHIPTTLLSMVDKSSGRKDVEETSMGEDLARRNPSNPQRVFIDFRFLHSLSRREFLNGMAKIIKTAILSSEVDFRHVEYCAKPLAAFLDKIESMSVAKRRSAWVWEEQLSAHLREIVVAAIMSRLEAVAEDGLRPSLCFGQALTQALETQSSLQLSRGECLALAMSLELLVAQALGHCQSGTVERVQRLLKQLQLPVSLHDDLLEAYTDRLPRKEDLRRAMQLNMKISDGTVEMMLVTQIGHARLLSMPEDAIFKVLEPDRSTKFCHVFAMPEMYEALCKHLDLPSVLNLSGTCKFYRALTRESSEFRNKNKLRLYSWKVSKDDLLQSQFIKWKNAELELGPWDLSSFKIILNLLQSSPVESFVVRGQPKKLSDAMAYELKQLFSHEQRLSKVVSFRTLKCFDVTISIFESEFCSTSTAESLAQHLSSLQELRIETGDPATSAASDNLRKLAANPRTSFRLKKFHFYPGRFWNRNAMKTANEMIVSVLETHQQTLESLEIEEISGFWKLNGIRSLVCPLLRNLKTNVTARAQAGLAGFIKNNSEFTHLVIKQEHAARPDQQRAIRFLPLEDALHACKSLKSLSLDLQNAGSTTAAASCRFLEEMQCLKKMKLRVSSLASLMEAQLPRSLNSVKIRPQNRESDPAVLAIHDAWLTSNLSRLTLTKLKLDVGLTDQSLQTICAHLRQLVDFEAHGSDALSDFGVTGRREGENTGISLRSLTGLQYLILGRWSNVSSTALRSVLSYPKLTHLTLHFPFLNADAIEIQELLVSVALQNPELRTFAAHIWPGQMHSVAAYAYLIHAKIHRVLPNFEGAYII